MVARVVIVGGGMAGSATALFSARRGHDVLVVDRDPGPPDGGADELARWDRPGVAQAGFSHYFLARSTRIVREEAPDLLDELAAVGIGPSSTTFGDRFEEDRALTGRRPVYEAVLRRFVAAEPGITFVQDSVRGLAAEGGPVPHVAGVRLADGEGVSADLVVDAGGRRSASGRWLEAAGVGRPAVQEEPCDRHYYCRHYRLRQGEDFPADQVPLVQPLPYGTLLLFIGDNRTFSVAFELSARDPLRKRLQEPDIFDRFLRAVPLTAEWLDRAEPVSDLRVMAGLSNRRRRLVVDGVPAVSGMALVGDSSQYTNPALGQGVSLSFWMAQQLARSVELVAEDPAGAAVAFEAWVDEELGPRFERQLRVDRENTRQLEAGLRGEGFITPAEEASRFTLAVWMLAQRDADVLQLVNRVSHLLEPPSAYWDDPVLVETVEDMLARKDAAPVDHGPLPRDRFEALVGA